MSNAPVFPGFIRLEAKGTDDAKAKFLQAVDQTMSAGEGRTAEFAATSQANIDRALKVPPGAASAFTAEVDRLALTASGRLESFAASARRNLDAALSGKVTASGGIDVDVAGAREAAAVAERRAAIARQLADATRNAALAEKDFSQATRLSIAAAKELAESEGQAAAAARVQADAAARLQAAMDRAGVSAKGLAGANDNLTRATGAQRQGMQQLGYQLGDIATMYALGAKPAQIFASQIGQITQAVQLMSGGTSRLAAFLGGPWGIALSTATIVAAPFIGRLYEIATGANVATGALQKLIEKQRQQQAEKATVPNAQKDIDALVKRRAELEADIAKRGVRNPKTGELQFVYRQQQELKSINAQIAEGRQALDNQRASAVSLDRIMGDLAAKRLKDAYATEKQTKAKVAKVKVDRDEIGELNKQLAAEIASIQKFAQWNEQALGKGLDRGMTGMFEALAAKQSRATDEVIRTANAQGAWNDQLAETIALLEQVGGAGSALAGIANAVAGLASGNYSGVRGPAGVLLKTIGSVGWASTDANGNRQIKLLGDEILTSLDKVFGSRGSFSKVLENAGIGSAAGQVFLGGKGNNIGSAIGGVLGKEAGAALFKGVGGALGKLGGPLGSIVGGVLGGALGSAFTKVSKGYAVVTNGGVTAGGNNADLTASSKTSGTGIQAALNNIADQLGGSIGNYAVSIGKRSSGYIRVSASGSSRVADKSFAKNGGADLLYDGKDEAEAMRVALLNALQDGAIKGIREGSQRLLKAGGDIDSALRKALSFEGVFRDLKAIKDPVGSALDAVNLEFRRLIDVFKEAGASSAEYAQLEELYGIKRADAVRDANERILGSLKGLKEFLGVNSDFYSLRDRQAQAQAIYNPLKARVQAGDATAFDGFAKASQDLLEIERQINGSTSAFYARADEIRALTDQAIAGKQAVSDAAAASDSPFTALASQQQATTSAIDNQTAALLAALGGINDNLVASLRARIDATGQSNTVQYTGLFAPRGSW
ncbi:MAG: hypothetical protein C0491_04595 [Novosphingobium sp.]|nr:hypothetical protein [Novosphingobium sp.]